MLEAIFISWTLPRTFKCISLWNRSTKQFVGYMVMFGLVLCESVRVALNVNKHCQSPDDLSLFGENFFSKCFLLYSFGRIPIEESNWVRFCYNVIRWQNPHKNLEHLLPLYLAPDKITKLSCMTMAHWIVLTICSRQSGYLASLTWPMLWNIDSTDGRTARSSSFTSSNGRHKSVWCWLCWTSVAYFSVWENVPLVGGR